MSPYLLTFFYSRWGQTAAVRAREFQREPASYQKVALVGQDFMTPPSTFSRQRAGFQIGLDRSEGGCCLFWAGIGNGDHFPCDPGECQCILLEEKCMLLRNSVCVFENVLLYLKQKICSFFR